MANLNSPPSYKLTPEEPTDKYGYNWDYIATNYPEFKGKTPQNIVDTIRFTPEDLAKEYSLPLEHVQDIVKNNPNWGQIQPDELHPVDYDVDWVSEVIPEVAGMSDQEYYDWTRAQGGIDIPYEYTSPNQPQAQLTKASPQGPYESKPLGGSSDSQQLPALQGRPLQQLPIPQKQPAQQLPTIPGQLGFQDYLNSVYNAQGEDQWRPGPVGPERNGFITRNLLGGLDEMQANLYGGGRTLTRLAESVTGANLSGIKDWMEEGVQRNEIEASRNPAKYNSYTEVDGIGSAFEYMGEKALRSLPHMIPYLAGGGIGGAVGKTALGRVAGGVLGQAATKQAAKKFTGDMVEKGAKDILKKWGARAGATAGGTIGHAGEIENEMTQAGGYEVPAWQTLAASVARAGLDTFGMETVLSRVVGETAAKSAMDVAKNVAKGMGIGALAEGPTEAAQEAIAIGLRAVHDPNYDWQADAPDRLMESLIAGAAAGGLTSGVGSGAKATLDALGARGSSSDAGDSTKPKEPDPGAIQTITDEDVLWDPDYVRRAAMEGNFAEQAKRAPKGFEDPINRDGAEAMVAQGFNPGEISDIELVGRLKRMAGETSVEETRQFLKDNDIEVSDSILVKSGLKAKESKKVDEPTVKPYEFSFKDEDGVATTVEVTDLGEGKYAVSIGGLDPVEVEASSPGNAAAVSSGRPVTQVKSGTVKPVESKGNTPESKGTEAATKLMERFKGAGDKADSIFYSEYSDEAIDQIYAGLDTNLSLDQRVAAKLDQVRTTRQALMDKVSTFDTMAEDEVKTELTKLSPEERAYVQGKTESKVLKDYIDAIQKVTETTPVNKYSDGVDETEVVERKAVKVNIGEKSTVYEAVKLKDGSYLIAAPDGTAVPISGLSPKEVRAFAKGINENAGGFASPWNDEKHGVDGVKIQRKGESKTDSSTEEPVPSEVYEDDIDSESGDKRVVQLMDNGVMRSFELVKLKDGKFATVKPDGGIVVLDKITPAAVNQALGVKKGAMARKWSESKDADMVPFPRKKREAKGKAEPEGDENSDTMEYGFTKTDTGAVGYIRPKTPPEGGYYSGDEPPFDADPKVEGKVEPEGKIEPEGKPEPVAATGNKPFKHTIAMTFKYGKDKRSDVKADTTFDAILNGERTSTLRVDGWSGTEAWKNVKAGDSVTFHDSTGRTVEVVIESVERITDMSTLDVEEVSKTEGWSPDVLQNKYLPKGKGGYYVKYRLASKQGTTTGSEGKAANVGDTTTSPQVVEGKWQKPEAKDTKYAEIRRPVFSEPTYAINTWEIGSKLAKDMPVADDAVIQELNKKQDFYKYTVISEDMANRVRTYLNWYVLTTGYKISDIELAAFELTDNSPVNAVALQYQYMSNGKRKIVISLRTDQHDKERGRVISRYNVVHELGHAVDMMRSAKVNYGISSSGKFRALLPLIVHDITTFMEGTVYNNPDYKGKTFVEVHPLKQIIAQGANTDVDYGSREVFAEIFALYFTNPGLLYEISPRSHKFIRSIVGVSPVATDRMSVSAGAIRRGTPIDLGNGTRNSKNSSTAGKRAPNGGRTEATDSISEDEQEIKDDTQTSKTDERSTTDAPSEDGAEQRTAREIKVRYDVTPTGKEYKDLRRAKEALEALEQDAINEEISRLEAEREALKNEKKFRDLTPEEESWIDRLSKIKLKWDGTKLQYELDGKVLSPEEHLKFIEQRKRFYTLEPQKNGTYTVNAYELRFDAPDPISEAKIEQYIEGAFKEVNDGKQTRTAKESTMEIITPDGKTRRISAPKITLLGAVLNGWVSVSKGGFRTVHESFSRGLAELIQRGYSLPPMKGGQKLADNSAKNKALQAKFNGLPPDLVVFSLRKGFKVRVKNLGQSRGEDKAGGYASGDIARIDYVLNNLDSYESLGGTYSVEDIENMLKPILEGVEKLDPYFTAFQLEGLPDNEVDTLIAQLKGKKDKALVRKVDEILLEAKTRRLDSVGDVDWDSLRNEVDPDGWLNEFFDDKEEYAEGVSDTERIAEQQAKEERPEGDPMAGHKRGTPTGIKPYGQDKPRSKLESLFDSVAEKIGLRTTFHVFQDKATLIKAMKSYIPYAPKTEVGKLEEAIKWVESEGDSEPLVIYNDWFSNWALRTPFIYVPANMSDAEAIRATAHEFGHIVKHAMLDGIIERARAGDKQAREVAEFLIPDQLLKEVLKGKNWRTSRENYIIDELMAINMERWISSNATPTNAVERFFKGMVDLMRGMIREIQRKAEELLQRSNVNRSKAVARQSYVNFNEFMSAMVGGNLNIYAGNLEEATDPIFRQLRDLKRKLATINANSAESARLTSRIEALQKRIDKGKPNFNLGSAVSELGKLSRDLEAEKSRAQNYDRTGSEPNAYRKQLDVRIKNLESQINDLQAKVDGARAVSAEAVSTNDRITETLKSELDKLKTRLRKTKSKESSDVFGALALLNREAIALLQGRGVTYKPTPSKAVESQVSYHLGLLQEIADNLTAPSPMSSIPVRDLFTTGQVLPHVADGRVGARFNGEDLYQSAKSYARQATGKVKTNKYSGPVASWISSLGDELNILSPVVRTIRSELDHMDGITAQFIKQAFQAIPSEILIEEAQWLPKLSAMLEGLPKPSGKWVRTGDQKALDEQRKSKYGQIGEHLNKATPLSQIKDGEVRKGVKAVRDFLHEFMFDETNGLNDKYALNIQKRERYFTGVLNLDRWRGGRDEIVPILVKTMNISTKQAAKLWLEIGDRTDGVLLDVDPAVMDHVLAPSLSAKYARFFTPETKAALWEYYESDIHAVTSSYVRSAIRRGIMQQHFGMYDMDAKAGKFILDPKTNKRVYNPMGKLDYFLNIERILHDKSRKEGLSHAEVDRIRGVLLPALMGRLGANHVTPKLRSFMSWTKTYFNISLLPLATLSSLPELGGIKMKLMEDPRYTKNMGLMRATLEKFKDPELTRLAGVIGVIQKDIVEHALSGDAHNGYMVPGAQKVNNAFFRAVQMKRWADFTRVVAMRLAHNAFQEAARAGDGTYLGQYGIKVSDVSGLGTANQAYKMALHKWVDEAVLRPGALHRPAWGSDARKQLLWYLMDYMWLFYEVTMQVTGKAMANRRGIARVLPLVALASIMLPLAALGYELRKLITQDMMADLIDSDYEPKELDELAYLWEITQRSGFLGPAQKLVDYDEATNRNKSAVINALGPIAEASVLLLDEGLDEFLIRYSPGMASSSPLRREYGPAIRDALTFSDE